MAGDPRQGVIRAAARPIPARAGDTSSVASDEAHPKAGAAPVLDGASVRLRPLRPDDRAALRAILAQPEVARWWDTADPDSAVDEWLEEDGDSVGFAIELDGRVVGSIQYAEENEPGYRHAGIDLFLDSDHRGRGFGPDAIRTLARHLIEARGHHRLTIDPAAANERAIRAYRKVGFRTVGVMRAYERAADGTWHDGLLMDLLAAELT
ncbi:MAG: GNAT family N-acetyltransferase [Chloroflexi bacterium]|nr:GNAT family N-acetyltransferase [Chloroflexota bacterium]